MVMIPGPCPGCQTLGERAGYGSFLHHQTLVSCLAIVVFFVWLHFPLSNVDPDHTPLFEVQVKFGAQGCSHFSVGMEEVRLGYRGPAKFAPKQVLIIFLEHSDV